MKAKHAPTQQDVDASRRESLTDVIALALAVVVALHVSGWVAVGAWLLVAIETERTLLMLAIFAFYRTEYAARLDKGEAG